jgi:hypothetical protein
MLMAARCNAFGCVPMHAGLADTMAAYSNSQSMHVMQAVYLCCCWVHFDNAIRANKLAGNPCSDSQEQTEQHCYHLKCQKRLYPDVFADQACA